MSYGPAVVVRWEDRETETGPETVGVRYPLDIAVISPRYFRTWRKQHAEAEIIDIKYGVAAAGSDTGFAPQGSIMVVYRERETPAEAGEEGEH